MLLFQLVSSCWYLPELSIYSRIFLHYKNLFSNSWNGYKRSDIGKKKCIVKEKKCWQFYFSFKYILCLFCSVSMTKTEVNEKRFWSWTLNLQIIQTIITHFHQKGNILKQQHLECRCFMKGGLNRAAGRGHDLLIRNVAAWSHTQLLTATTAARQTKVICWWIAENRSLHMELAWKLASYATAISFSS